MKKFPVFLILMNLCAPARPAAIARGPYIENMAADMATVRFRTDVDTVAWLSYGAWPDCERFMTLSPEMKEHAINLFGLLSDTTHCYRIYLGDSGGAGVYKAEENAFRTFRGIDKPYFNFLAFGDSGSGSEEQLELAAQMEKFDPDFIAHTGDMVESGLDANANMQYFGPYKKMLAKYPFFLALGNHDYGNRNESKKFLRENYIPFHSMPRTGLPPYFYYFDEGNARFFVLDANYFSGAKWAQPLDKGSKQYKWLERFLSKTEKTWKFVMLHQPVYSTGAHGAIEAQRAALEPLFQKYKVDMVFQGHDHNYERTRPVKDGIPDDKEGIVYITFGGGGRPLYFQRANEDWSEKFLPVYHFAHIEIKEKNFAMNVYDKEGRVIDTFEVQK
ncbi:MAG: metallophosphoesterase [Elusimicrobia bacterium]|nr:metallophosphoesterase [Elusimicrobiota bacterium]